MNLEVAEIILQWAGGLLAYGVLGVILYGLWRGSQRQAGRVTGISPGWLRSAWFYPACTVFFFGVCVAAWKPFPLVVSPSLRIGMLALGSLLLFPGLLFALWGRLALGKNYFVSTDSAPSYLPTTSWLPTGLMPWYATQCTQVSFWLPWVVCWSTARGQRCYLSASLRRWPCAPAARRQPWRRNSPSSGRHIAAASRHSFHG